MNIKKKKPSLRGRLIKVLVKAPGATTAYWAIAVAILANVVLFLAERYLGLGIWKMSAILPTAFSVCVILFLAGLRHMVRSYGYDNGISGDDFKKNFIELALGKRQKRSRSFFLNRMRENRASEYIFPVADKKNALMRKLAELNTLAFGETVYQDSFENKLRRNCLHQGRNPKCLMLISHPIINKLHDRHSETEDFVSFTHLVPVSEETLHKYLNGEISDKSFSSDLICKPDQQASAIIVFSVALHLPSLKRRLLGGDVPVLDRITEFLGLVPPGRRFRVRAESDLWYGLLHHVHQLLDSQQFTDSDVTVIVQSYRAKTIKTLESAGFKQRTEKSADGELILEMKISRARESNRPFSAPAPFEL